MQISRHWRLNSQRYRLEGYRYSDGKLSLQSRPAIVVEENPKSVPSQQQHEEIVVPVA